MDPLTKADEHGASNESDDVSLERNSDISFDAWEEQDDNTRDSDRPRHRIVHDPASSCGDWPRSADSPLMQVPREEAESGVLSEIFGGQHPDEHFLQHGAPSKRPRPTDQSLEQVLMTPRFLRGRPSSASAAASATAAARKTERANLKKVNHFLRKPVLGLSSSSASAEWAPQTVVTGAASILRSLRQQEQHGNGSRSLTPPEDSTVANQDLSPVKGKSSNGSDSSDNVSFASSDDDDFSLSSNDNEEGSRSECSEVNAPRGASPTLSELSSEQRCAGQAVQAPVKATSMPNMRVDSPCPTGYNMPNMRVDSPSGDATGNCFPADMSCAFPKEQYQEQPVYCSTYSTTFNTDAWATSEAYNSAGPSHQQPCEETLDAEAHQAHCRELLLHELISNFESTTDPSTMVSPTRPIAQKPDRLAPRTVHQDVVRVDN